MTAWAINATFNGHGNVVSHETQHFFYSQYVHFPPATTFAGDADWQYLNIGGGGFCVQLDYKVPGVLLTCPDTNVPYIYVGAIGSGYWKELCTEFNLPPELAYANTSVAGQSYTCVAGPGGRIYFVMGTGHILTSPDGGNTWTALFNHPLYGSGIQFSEIIAAWFSPWRTFGPRSAVVQSNPNIWYLGLPRSGLWLTTDAGVTWVNLSAGGSGVGMPPASAAVAQNTVVANGSFLKGDITINLAGPPITGATLGGNYVWDLTKGFQLGAAIAGGVGNQIKLGGTGASFDSVGAADVLVMGTGPVPVFPGMIVHETNDNIFVHTFQTDPSIPAFYKKIGLSGAWTPITSPNGPYAGSTTVSAIFDMEIGSNSIGVVTYIGNSGGTSFTNGTISTYNYVTDVWKTLLNSGGAAAFQSGAVDPAGRSMIVADIFGNNYYNFGGSPWTSGWSSLIRTIPMPVGGDTPWLDIARTTNDPGMPRPSGSFTPGMLAIDSNLNVIFSFGTGVLMQTLPTSGPAPTTSLWIPMSKGIQNLGWHAVVIPQNGSMIAGAADYGIFRSVDTPTAVPFTTDITHNLIAPNTFSPCQSMTVAPFDDNGNKLTTQVFIAAVKEPTYGGTEQSGYSNNGGQDWKFFNPYPNTLDPGTGNWHPNTPGANKPLGVLSGDGAIRASSPNHMVWLTQSAAGPWLGMFYTTKGPDTSGTGFYVWAQSNFPPGINWQKGTPYNQYFGPDSVCADPNVFNRFYFYFWSDNGSPPNTYFPWPYSGFYRSDDGGANWSMVSAGNPGMQQYVANGSFAAGDVNINVIGTPFSSSTANIAAGNVPLFDVTIGKNLGNISPTGLSGSTITLSAGALFGSSGTSDVLSLGLSRGSSKAVLVGVPYFKDHYWFAYGESTAGSYTDTGGNPDKFSFLFRSTDGCQTWTRVPNLFQVINVSFGAPVTANGYPTIFIIGWLFNGTTYRYGIYMSTDTTDTTFGTWTMIGRMPCGSGGHSTLIVGDPNYIGRVYWMCTGQASAYLPGTGPAYPFPTGGAAVWPINATLNGAGSVQSHETQKDVIAAVFNGAGLLQPHESQQKAIAGAFGGAGTLAATARQGDAVSATFGGVGTYQLANAHIGLKISAELDGAGALQADVKLRYPISSTFGGAGSVVVNETQQAAIRPRFSGAGSLQAVTYQGYATSSALHGAGVVQGSVNVGYAVNVTFGGSGSLVAHETLQEGTIRISAIFQGSGVLVSNENMVLPVMAIFNGQGLMTIQLHHHDEYWLAEPYVNGIPPWDADVLEWES